MNVGIGNSACRLFALLCLVPVSCAPVIASGPDSVIVVERRSGYSPKPPRVFRVYAGGKFEQLVLPADHWEGEPSQSPDGEHVAYYRGLNVWIRHVRSGRDTQLTELVRSGGDQFHDFDFSISAWSPDSTRLLVYGGQEDGPYRLEKRPIQKGIYDCDIARRSCRHVPLLDKMLLMGRASNGDHIAASKSIPSNVRRISSSDLQAKPMGLLAVRGEYGYPLVSVSRDGNWLAAFEVERRPWGWMDTFRSIFGLYEIPPEKPILLNLVTGERRQPPGLTNRQQLSGWNQLKLSPTGVHVAYHGSVLPGGPKGVVVDGRKLSSANGRITWINDEVLVVEETERIAVVDAGTDSLIGSIQVEVGIRPVPRSP
jgi:hypothetical protein